LHGALPRNGASSDNYVREARQRENDMKKTSSKLALNRDTLRNLSASSLHDAAGGILTSGCNPTLLCQITIVNCNITRVGCPTGFDCTDLC
jgi:hypothetical protein